jgi:hypothetical protein
VRTHPLWRLGLALCLAAMLGLAGLAQAQKRDVTVDKIDYAGWKNNLRMSNGDVELIVTLDVGPRILSYKLTGGVNVLKEFKEQLGKSGEKSWQIRGGHRLWVGPEDLTRTYFPDNRPVKYKVESPGVVLVTAPPEKEFGLQKEIEIHLAPKGSEVKLIHRIKNVGEKPTELAPWALTVMAPGGLEIIPLPEHKPHPGSAGGAKTPDDFAPNLRMVFWPYFDFTDKRCSLGHKYATLKQDRKAKGPIKFGLLHLLQWIAYLNQNTLFVKHLPAPVKGKTYPDKGCNFETYSDAGMLEIESLGPLITLAPGQTVELSETWHLFGDVRAVSNEEEIDRVILPIIKKK